MLFSAVYIHLSRSPADYDNLTDVDAGMTEMERLMVTGVREEERVTPGQIEGGGRGRGGGGGGGGEETEEDKRCNHTKDEPGKCISMT